MDDKRIVDISGMFVWPKPIGVRWRKKYLPDIKITIDINIAGWTRTVYLSPQLRWGFAIIKAKVSVTIHKGANMARM